MGNQVPNTTKGMYMKGQIKALTDVYKMILMKPGFVFDKANHHCYADVSASEMITAFGYTVGGSVLAGVSLTIDDVEERAELAWNNIQWTATGGILTISGAIIIDDTLNTAGGDDYDDGIISYKEAAVTAEDGTPIVFSSIMETLEGKYI